MIYVCRRYSHVTRQNQWFHLISATLGVLRAETTLLAFSTLFESVWCNMSMLSFALCLARSSVDRNFGSDVFFKVFTVLEFWRAANAIVEKNSRSMTPPVPRSSFGNLGRAFKAFFTHTRDQASEEDEKNVRVGSVFKSQEFNCLYYSIPG